MEISPPLNTKFKQIVCFILQIKTESLDLITDFYL
jgi:hypothetical protein